MARPVHHYGFTAVDPVLGIRVGVNAADIANAKKLPPRGAVMRRAVELAILAHKVAPRNVAPTLRVEHLDLAIKEKGGLELTKPVLHEAIVVGGGDEVERLRRATASKRYAENRAIREAAKAAKAAERKARREAAKARKAETV